MKSVMEKNMRLSKIDEALITAARRNNVRAVKVLLKLGASQQARDKALEEATRWRRFEIVDVLLKENISNGEKDTALCMASYFGNKAIVELLLESGVSQKAKDEALIKAVCASNLEITELLLRAGTSQSARDKALEREYRDDLPITKLLLRAGVSQKAKDIALIKAADRCNVEKAKILMSEGADPNANIQDASALNCAICLKYSAETMVKVLLQGGAVPTKEDIKIAKSLHKPGVVALLLKAMCVNFFTELGSRRQ